MINYDLTKIRAIIFDVDGVLSCNHITLSPEGEPLRTANIKDGYAMHLAQELGLRLAIMTGGKTNAVRVRYADLGLEDIYLGCNVKITTYEEFKKKYSLKDSEIIYVGDDIPDYQIMKLCGCPCCPKDACPEIQQISTYVSPKKGGKGVARDIIEQVLRAQDKWMKDNKAFGW